MLYIAHTCILMLCAALPCAPARGADIPRPMKKTAAVNLRMTEELRDRLQRLAEENRRNISDYIRLVLEEHADAEEQRRARKAARKAAPKP